ncbi:MAG: M48 family metallopeptidase [Lachnospiraceae bacterium]|nr:M48 family metallopeptidase [Lachnospiraceae bacterium]
MGYDNISIIKSKRKTIEIQIKPDMSIVVRAPLKATKRDILRFIEDKSDWINKNINQMMMKKMNQPEAKKLSNEELKSLASDAMIYIPGRVKYFAEIIGVSYSRITIRNQKTRWGSCSAKGGLNFNCLLMLTPNDVIDYVVVHELCHRLEMNHSKAFWAHVEEVLPDYKKRRKWLKDNGNALMERMI